MEQQTTIESLCHQLKTVAGLLMPTSCNTPEDRNLEEKINAVTGIENVLHRQNRCQKNRNLRWNLFVAVLYTCVYLAICHRKKLLDV